MEKDICDAFGSEFPEIEREREREYTLGVRAQGTKEKNAYFVARKNRDRQKKNRSGERCNSRRKLCKNLNDSNLRERNYFRIVGENERLVII